MKIYIGQYPKWIGPYQVTNMMRYIGVSEERCDKIAEWLPNKPFQWFYDKFCNRTVKIKLHHYDHWNLDGTLALIIAPALKQLKANCHGYPAPLYNENDLEGSAIRKWEEILDKMIWSFERCQGDLDFYNEKDRENHDARIQEGLNLFAEYYRNLWD